MLFEHGREDRNPDKKIQYVQKVNCLIPSLWLSLFLSQFVSSFGLFNSQKIGYICSPNRFITAFECCKITNAFLNINKSLCYFSSGRGWALFLDYIHITNQNTEAMPRRLIFIIGPFQVYMYSISTGETENIQCHGLGRIAWSLQNLKSGWQIVNY